MSPWMRARTEPDTIMTLHFSLYLLEFPHTFNILLFFPNIFFVGSWRCHPGEQ